MNVLLMYAQGETSGCWSDRRRGTFSLFLRNKITKKISLQKLLALFIRLYLIILSVFSFFLGHALAFAISALQNGFIFGRAGGAIHTRVHYI